MSEEELAEANRRAADKKNGLINPGDPDSDIVGASDRLPVDLSRGFSGRLDPYIYPSPEDDGGESPVGGGSNGGPQVDPMGGLTQPTDPDGLLGGGVVTGPDGRGSGSGGFPSVAGARDDD